MEMNTGILRNVHAEEYGFSMDDLIVAAMLKAYLQTLRVDEVPGQLGRIVSAGMRNLRGGTVKGRGLAKEEWSELDRDALAVLIDNARTAATISAMEWQAQEGERLLDKTISLLRDEVFPALSGENYVAAMPVGMAEFITDCWLTVA